MLVWPAGCGDPALRVGPVPLERIKEATHLRAGLVRVVDEERLRRAGRDRAAPLGRAVMADLD
ncbi:MAG TPA: hypothetical protein VGR27_10100, partial [Longimicrobiaceae bacterium]|nr:hypothetical protein [Longimicrobiaceae bacterium]